MEMSLLLQVIGWADGAALALLVGLWLWIGWRVEHPAAARPSVTVLMDGYRRAWMAEFARREARIFDATILSSLRQATAFFASTALLAIGGVLALLGNPAPLEGLASDIVGEASPALVWQSRLALVALFLVHAFLRFVWANRVFGYCSVVMGAVPQDDTPRAQALAAQAAELNIRAAYNFNRGLRSMYFSLAAMAWILGPVALAVAAVAVTAALWSREFRSTPGAILRDDP